MTTLLDDIRSLTPSALIELFEVDATMLPGGGLFRFHSGTNELNSTVYWQGYPYVPTAIQAQGFDISGRGVMPRPTISVANTTKYVSAIVAAYGDLVGAKVTRRRTLAKFLDAINFIGGSNPTADASAHLPDDVYYVNRKVKEGRAIVEFELAAAWDVEGVLLPGRQVIQNTCVWRYRRWDAGLNGGSGGWDYSDAAECGYTGNTYATATGAYTQFPTEDRCGRRLSDCIKRHGQNAELPYGGFPACNAIGR